MAELRKCSRCKCTILLETYFSKNRKGEYFKTCDRCRERKKQYYENNKENKKQYYENNKEKIAERMKQYRLDNKEKIAESDKQYRLDNKDKIAENVKQYQKDKRHHCEHKTEKQKCNICNPAGHLKSIVSSRVRAALGRNKSKKSIEYLGCDIRTFRLHIETSFKKGMTWDNHGYGEDKWHIDHILPVMYSEDGSPPDMEIVAERLHYTNTQAMWQTENISKGNRFIG